MTEHTVSSIVESVDKIDTSTLPGVMHAIITQEVMVNAMLSPLKDREVNQWGYYFHHIAAILEPIAAALREGGIDQETYQILASKAYNDAVVAAIAQLHSLGSAVELGTKDDETIIRAPKRLSQYDSDIRGMLKVDKTGEMLALDEHGEYKYRAKSGFEQLRKRLRESDRKAKQEKALLDAQKHGLSFISPAAAAANGISQPTSNVNNQAKPDAPVQPKELDALDKAIEDLRAIARVGYESDAKAADGRPLSDDIIARLQKTAQTLTNYMVGTLKMDLSASLNKAAAKAA